MQKQLFSFWAQHMDQRRLRLVLVVVSLALFVLGAGAPEQSGGAGG